MLSLQLVVALVIAVSGSHIPRHQVESPLQGNHEAHVLEDTNSTLALRQATTPFWYETIAHQGISPFGPSGYTIYRNVMDYGAKGDGVTDDTAAINSAMNAGGRCGQGCTSTTVTPAVVYFPAGTYLISSSIIDQYYTNIIGNPNNPPVLKASPSFSGFGLIDGDKYYSANLNWVSTNVFYRQVRNFVFDLTAVSPSSNLAGIHWPTAQATSLQNIVFQMSSASGTQHVGVFCESGSAGFMNDLTFNGGNLGLQVGNQQFTMRNIAFNNVVTAISQLWDWGWVYQGLTINNCQTGIDISAGGSSGQEVGSVIIIDSTITNTPIGVVTAFDSTSSPATAGSLILENVVLNNVPTAVKQAAGGTLLAGSTGTTTIAAWGEGNSYTPNGPQRFQGVITPVSRPASLLSGSVYYSQSKPQYGNLPSSSFVSVRSAGAQGNGNTDDTVALQNAINSATAAGQVVYFDAGIYKITTTLFIPPGAKLVGEAYAVIMSSGSFFNDMNNPQAVVRVGNAGESGGQVQWSDMIVSTQGAQAGAVAIEWNLDTTGTPSGMWDVHVRIGGFTGSNLQVGQCAKTPGNPSINANCIGAYMLMHVTPSASNLYLENNWFWTADHDIDDSDPTAGNQLTIYSGRGLFVESTAGNIWLVGTAVEHNTLYQYQLANTQNIFMGFVQTETPYYQPVPSAPAPFSVVTSLNDPNFATSCVGQSGNCANAWGLRIVDSSNVLVYGTGLYSFFNDYSTNCSNAQSNTCQTNIFSVEGTNGFINVYCLSTLGSTNMITQNGNSIAAANVNLNVYPDTIAEFRLAGVAGVVGSPPSILPPSSPSSPPATQPPVSSISSPPAIQPSSSPPPSITQPSSSTLPSPSTRPSSSQWNFKGCYTDSVYGRTLSVGPIQIVENNTPKSLTIERCLTGCKAMGLVYAGVEYTDQCFCDSALRNGGKPAPDGNVGCNMPCNGNRTEICGGANRLDLYTFGF